MKRKSIVLAATAVMLMASLVVGGTLAYFTDTDDATNTFTVGDVKIDLIESQYYPQVDTDKTLDDVVADSETYLAEYLAVNGEDMVPGRWVRKAPYVINTGTNDAYVRIHMDMSKELWDVVEVMFNSTEVTINQNIAMSVDESADPVRMTFTYNDAIPASTEEGTESDNMTPYAPVWQFRLMEALDNDDLAAIQGDVVSNINVYAEAIQAEGFADAAAAFAAYDAQQ